MTHIRRQIRDAVGAALKGKNALVGQNVFTARAKRFDATELPVILVRSVDETSRLGDKDGTEIRDLQIDIVIAAASDLTHVADILDGIAVTVETEMLTALAALDFRHELQSTAYRDQVEGAEEFAFLTLTYEVTYHVAEGVPETAV